ncbi:sodium-coupled monocarboxylate transporter 2-like [Photinus pyralis]|uniref:sodium-coupled monocarboxylate transporter 2-like n=1 Tax=Photinus pyralis TaxID=7054 RepID=UPI001266E73A|nr:sodium-coupled monocarboxylate transporter 2-like [Photinus pyralis]
MFTPLDYFIFSASIIVSLCIGLYFGLCKKRQSADDYLLGNRSMKLVPIGLSMIASQISGVTLLAYPSEIYTFGANALWMCLAVAIACAITCYVYLPVIAKLKTPSIFQYVELRFGRRIKIITSGIYTLQVMFYNAIVIHLSAISFSQASGINSHVIEIIVCVTCILYTTVGGFKTVIWTDVVQLAGMVVAVFMVFILSVISAGGINRIYEKALEGHRLDFNFSADMTKKDGFWQILTGNIVIWIYNITFQAGVVQKYISLSSISNSKRAALMLGTGAIAFHLIGILMGIALYAKYSNCDPLTSGQITRADQIVSFFVTQHDENVPGLAGIFTAGIMCSGLSTLSATLNTLAATIYSDFISPFFPSTSLRSKEGCVLKLIVILTGLICTTLILFIERMSGILPFFMSLLGLVSGIFVGVFSLGMVFPLANAKGAFWAMAVSFLTVGSITIGNQWYTLQGGIESFAKPVSIDNCSIPINVTATSGHLLQPPFILFRLSVWYISVISLVLVIAIGLLVSWVTKRDGDVVDPELLSPLLIKKDTKIERMQKYLPGQPYCDTTYNFDTPTLI